MFQILKTSFFMASLVTAVACSNQAVEQSQGTALQRYQSFEDSRASLAALGAQHLSNVMSRNGLTDVTLDEVRFHDQSVGALQDMEWNLRVMATCKNASGEFMQTDNALAALRDLRNELTNHKIGMLTMIDRETARATEDVSQKRQGLLLDELDAYRAEFEAIADQYRCEL